jgi:hypothetical protein
MWPFRKRDRQAMKESQQAILEATRKLRDVQARDKEVHEVSGALRDIRKRNHFAEQLRTIMQGG